MQIAQTNIQLYNQLREAGRPLDELVSVRRAYEFVTTLYPGYFQADGKPFVAHSVGVASIVAWLDQPTDFVVVGLLHNIYGNADFGDGAKPGITPRREQLVKEAVGENIAELLERFRELRIRPATLPDIHRSLPNRSETDRRLILVELADQLEKYVDLGLLYYGNDDWVPGHAIGSQLVMLANDLGEPSLATMFSSVLAEAASAHVPPELRSSDGRRYLKLVVPRSCRRRLTPRVRARLRSVLRR